MILRPNVLDGNLCRSTKCCPLREWTVLVSSEILGSRVKEAPGGCHGDGGCILHSVYKVWVLQRNITNRMDGEIQRDIHLSMQIQIHMIYYKHWLTQLWRLKSPKTCSFLKTQESQ